ncbi:putative LRR receptor-like serine/threonine-protein kinase [Iris pallida]|uniref:LRR receptor-like serine/threonine-protein kinase n=1 Tax=Iris pallida TaxID=29817 RepID=A0AAX6GVL7_IRIPA|nr:putative LRR receptor-like serine/threonine-protein kinase [Iris pallida]
MGLAAGMGEDSGRLLWDCTDLLLPKSLEEVPGLPPDRRRSSPKSPILASISDPRRMLLGLMLPCVDFFSWMYARPLATPRAILSLASQLRLNGDEPDFSANVYRNFVSVHYNYFFRMSDIMLGPLDLINRSSATQPRLLCLLFVICSL